MRALGEALEAVCELLEVRTARPLAACLQKCLHAAAALLLPCIFSAALTQCEAARRSCLPASHVPALPCLCMQIPPGPSPDTTLIVGGDFDQL